LKVQVISFDDLSSVDIEAFDGFYDIKYANFIRIEWPDGTVQIEHDRCEPEDATLGRDYAWVAPAIRRAFKEGLKAQDLPEIRMDTQPSPDCEV
jgi:hypothetical protein